jgi:hypothetical protein
LNCHLKAPAAAGADDCGTKWAEADGKSAFAAKFTRPPHLALGTDVSKGKSRMDVNEQSAVSRQFMASLPAYSSKWTNGAKYFQAGYAVFFVAFVLFALLMVFGPLWGVHLHFPHIGAAVGYGVPVGMLIVGVGMAAYLFWRSRRKVLITVTNDQLTVDRRPGVAFAFGDAQLGSWVAMGVALHLQCGRHRFLLGGRDRRVSPTTSLIAPPVRLVEA